MWRKRERLVCKWVELNSGKTGEVVARINRDTYVLENSCNKRTSLFNISDIKAVLEDDELGH